MQSAKAFIDVLKVRNMQIILKGWIEYFLQEEHTVFFFCNHLSYLVT